MIKLVLEDIDATETLRLVGELKQQGLKTGYDFDFKFVPRKDDCQDHSICYTEFIFYQEKYATLFAIRYVK